MKEKSRFGHPPKDGGVAQFRATKPEIIQFAEEIEQAMRVSAQEMKKEVNI
jgi:hypothetical protein